MTERIELHGLKVARPLHDMIVNEALPGTGITADTFWKGLSGLVHELGPKNRALLARRDALQARLDAWHAARRGKPLDAAEYTAYLKEIGYLTPEGPDFAVDTANVDPEIASIPGPQLVVPVMNARYALNAANARWGSLYDALYGTDAMGDAPQPGGYDEARGARVIAWAKDFLDKVAPLAGGAKHADVTGYSVSHGALQARTAAGTVGLADPKAFVGHAGSAEAPSAVLLKHNHLHVEIRIDASHAIGRTDRAHVADVLLEAAITTIMDCEDSVAAVDADDKALAYRNWLGLMKGDLVETVAKGGGSFQRTLNGDRTYTGADGEALTL
ncbi:MAG: malate synthase G, partial [Burkholderiales bacterium]